MERTLPTPKKRLGQNFLQSSFYAQRIASCINCPAGDGTVVEIGPGLGALSVFLLRRFPKLHLIETDGQLIPHLEEKLGKGEWTLHNANVLKFDFTTIPAPIHIIGNLPYNIGALIIKKTLLNAPAVASITYMVQREVADRIVAGPHSKQNGFLSIFCQFFGIPKIICKVPPGAFFPPPKVESAVFHMDVIPDILTRLPREQWDGFFTMVSEGFSKRRKTLATSLGWKKDTRETIASVIEQIGLNRKVRPEDLDIEEWLALYRNLRMTGV